MTVATRSAVQSWLGQPWCLAPCRRSCCNWPTCSSLRRGVGPLWGVAAKLPCPRARRRQRWIEVSCTPRMRATVVGDSPCSTCCTARRRRRSSSLAVPIGLVIPHYTDVQCLGQAIATLDSVTPNEVRKDTKDILPFENSFRHDPSVRIGHTSCVSAFGGVLSRQGQHGHESSSH